MDPMSQRRRTSRWIAMAAAAAAATIVAVTAAPVAASASADAACDESNGWTQTSAIKVYFPTNQLGSAHLLECYNPDDQAISIRPLMGVWNTSGYGPAPTEYTSFTIAPSAMNTAFDEPEYVDSFTGRASLWTPDSTEYWHAPFPPWIAVSVNYQQSERWFVWRQLAEIIGPTTSEQSAETSQEAVTQTAELGAAVGDTIGDVLDRNDDHAGAALAYCTSAILDGGTAWVESSTSGSDRQKKLASSLVKVAKGGTECGTNWRDAAKEHHDASAVIHFPSTKRLASTVSREVRTHALIIDYLDQFLRNFHR